MTEARRQQCTSRRALAWMLALALVALGAAHLSRAQAQGNSSAAKPAPAQAQPRAAQAPRKPTNGGTHEGITVHGHWVIEVRNPDGKLVSHTEFENSLEQPTGGQYIAQILGGTAFAGEYAIALPVPCSSYSFCVLSQTGGAAVPSVGITSDVSSAFGGAVSLICSGAPVGTCTQTLSVVVNGGSIVLQGSAVAQAAGSVGGVESLISRCGTNGVTPYTQPQCGQQNGEVEPLTGATVTPVVPFSGGQTVSVTVTISFQ